MHSDHVVSSQNGIITLKLITPEVVTLLYIRDIATIAYAMSHLHN